MHGLFPAPVVERNVSAPSQLSIAMRIVRRLTVGLALGVLVAGCSDDPTGPSSYPARQSPRGVRLAGPTRILVIATRFADSPEPALDPSAIRTYLFGNAPQGHLRRLFLDASEGAFTLTGDVTPWIRTTVPTNLLGEPGVLSASMLWDHAIEAIYAADETINFALYDNDGPDGRPNSGDDDGYVDGGVAILHPERNFVCGSGARGPHPHAITNLRTRDGEHVMTQDAQSGGDVIRIRAYTMMGATDCTTNEPGYAILAHELGHILLGLPDLYHPVSGAPPLWAGRRWVVGCWELMGAGSWGCGEGAPPSHPRASSFGAWSRAELGWATPIEIDPQRDTTYVLSPVGRGGTVLRIPVSPDEYLLVEYREPSATDITLPSNGVLIYRVRPALTQLPPPTAPREYRVMLVEADADSTLRKVESEGGNRGEVDDAFGGARSSFSPDTHPEATASDGTPLPFQITEITLEPAQHRARLRIGPRL